MFVLWGLPPLYLNNNKATGPNRVKRTSAKSKLAQNKFYYSCMILMSHYVDHFSNLHAPFYKLFLGYVQIIINIQNIKDMKGHVFIPLRVPQISTKS